MRILIIIAVSQLLHANLISHPLRVPLNVTIIQPHSTPSIDVRAIVNDR